MKNQFFSIFPKNPVFRIRERPGKPGIEAGEARGSPGDAGECRGEARSSGESSGELRGAPEVSGELWRAQGSSEELLEVT